MTTTAVRNSAPNSNLDDVTPDWSDQTGIFDPKTFAEPVVVIGCGGIGATLLPVLATMGVQRVVLWDPDTVEHRNMASQLLYRTMDLYRPKVDVCAEHLRYFGVQDVVVHQELFTADSPIEGSVVIGAVDSMAARQTIWQRITQSPEVQLYMDGRIGGQMYSLFTVDPADGDWYQDHYLFGDDRVVPLPCTERAIVYPAVELAAKMCAHLAHWHAGETPSRMFHGDMKIMDVTEVV